MHIILHLVIAIGMQCSDACLWLVCFAALLVVWFRLAGGLSEAVVVWPGYMGFARVLGPCFCIGRLVGP